MVSGLPLRVWVGGSENMYQIGDCGNPRETRRLVRLIRAVIVAWVLTSVLLLWLVTRAKPAGDVPSVRPLSWSSKLRTSPAQRPSGSMGQVLTVERRV